MVDLPELKQLVAAIPGAIDDSSDTALAFSTDKRGFAWTFMQRDTPKQKRWPNLQVLAVRCPLETKELLIEAAPDIYFDDDHYRGYQAVLVRLPVISAEELKEKLEASFAFTVAHPERRRRRT